MADRTSPAQRFVKISGKSAPEAKTGCRSRTRPAMACRFRIFVLELTLLADACLDAVRVKLSSKPRLLHQCDLYGGGEGHLTRPNARTPDYGREAPNCAAKPIDESYLSPIFT
jgi:hypothetical protein